MYVISNTFLGIACRLIPKKVEKGNTLHEGYINYHVTT